MSKLQLVGVGAAYLRVSTDTQDANRQVESVKGFATRNNATISKQYWFEDHGWSRDAHNARPAFNRLLDLARKGEVKWIVVDSLDRFGTKTAKHLFGYLADLEDAGCKLFDASGKEWTGEDDGTEITAWVGGKTSTREQKEKSKRSLGGMVAGAKAGEWMGSPPQLGFDVACFDKATGKELWRVVWEGRQLTDTSASKGKPGPARRDLRRKEYPDGTQERFDGKVKFRTSEDIQVMRLAPTKDQTKLAAVKTLFRKYATEAVTFYDLAKWINKLGVRSAAGSRFQGAQIARLLADESYLGYPTFNKRARGRFHRYDKEGGIVELEPEVAGKERTNAPEDVVRSSTRLFDPIIDRETWDKVQTKLSGRTKVKPAPRVSKMYLTGLVVCAGCGKAMNTRGERGEYVCATWNRHRLVNDIANSPCQSNPVKQSVIEEYAKRYLDETQQRLSLLIPRKPETGLTGKLEKMETTAWLSFRDGITRLQKYLAEHHSEEYAALIEEFADRSRFPDPGTGSPDEDDFAFSVLGAYEKNFDPAAVAAERERLEAEHTTAAETYRDLPTPRAKEKAKAKLIVLEARLDELDQQGSNLAETVAGYYREMRSLECTIEQRAKGDER